MTMRTTRSAAWRSIHFYLLGLVLLSSSSLNFDRSAFAEEAETVVLNANVLLCDAEMTSVAAFAVSKGRIVDVGSSEEIRKWIGQDTQVIDADGKTVTPGLTDSHLHFIGLGESLQMLDLREAESWSEIVQQVTEAAKKLPKGTWIEGRGWHQSKWIVAPEGSVDGYPNHLSMSELVPDHPVVLTHASGHACFANEAAMRIAGVDANTSDPNGGEILKDESGQPIGVFRENAQSLIRSAKAKTTERLDLEARRSAVQTQLELAGTECLRYGITSVHDASSSFATARLLKDFAENQQLPVRMAVMIREGSRSLAAQMKTHRWESVGNGMLSVRSVKVSIDGALGPHGAWLLQPYSDLPSTSGLNTVALDELQAIAELCKQYDWQLCVHAIGDRANREVLDTYEKVLTSGGAAGDHRWRIEHAQHLSPEDIPRFGKLGVIPAMQANHCTSDAIFVPTRLGERRSAQGAYVWRSLIDSGAIVPNGTDAPVERVDPRASLFAAVTRRISTGDAFYPEQCMTREEALLSYTLWPAIAAFQEKQIGSLEVGKFADFVIWDNDLLTCPPDDILTTNALATYLAGKLVYSAKE